ncbi:hypothetical protein ERJ70_05625 [Sediminibacillus dalangtanensis]|uniref:TraB family protein n=2 Tax=Sediminibacillus dalangtanensis TaxID=2729421 RepID=A0ABX7VZX2_9BACI|nr:hypothetical protein ERJ70_05625 [Sediminibacillus dalangtanensis]
MVFGTFHMRYTPDLFRYQMDGTLTEQNKQDIKKVVDCLKEFQPTKIALEVEKKHHNTLNHDFQQYRNGKFSLEVNEIHQFGFRCADELNHHQVYAVDWMESLGNIGIGQAINWAKTEQPEMYELITEHYQPQINTYSATTNIVELIMACNMEVRSTLDHEMNMAVARIGKEENYVGIDWLRWWYQRNLILYANLAEITAAGDRTLLIIGAGHIHLLTRFLQESGQFDVIPALDYLTF